MHGRSLALVATTGWLTLLLALQTGATPIDDLVSQISQANLTAHIAALEGPRASAAEQAVAADYIAQQLESYGYTVVRDPVGTSENLRATLLGTGTPDRVFVVGAHFDTVPGSPGADDNASGVAGMLEIARVMAGTSFASTVEFVAFGLEEVGLLGSTQYAQSAFGAGVDIVGMISLEMIGYASDLVGSQTPFVDALPCLDVDPAGGTVGNFIGVVGNTASSGLVADFLGAAAHFAPALPVTSGIVAGTGGCFPDTRRSDHAPFWDVGYEALMLTDTANFRNPNYHEATDTLATLDLAFATEVTKATLGLVATVVIPEPTTLGLLVLGIAGLGALRRGKRTS